VRDSALPLMFAFAYILCPKTSSLLMVDKGCLVYRIIIIYLTKYLLSFKTINTRPKHDPLMVSLDDTGY